jgi:hypothetical protein
MGRGGGSLQLFKSYQVLRSFVYIMKCSTLITITFAPCVFNYTKKYVKGKNDNCLGED